MKYNFQEIDYPIEMENFIFLWLNNYDYNSKATNQKPFVLWKKTIHKLLETKFENNITYEKVKNLPQEEISLLVKCLGHYIGVWDLHSYYYLWFVK